MLPILSSKVLNNHVPIHPAGIYLLKVNNRNTSTVNFEQVIAGWDTVFHGVNQIINTNIYIFQVKLIGIISI